MKLTMSEDQRELQSVAREMLADLAPLSLARAFLEGEGDAAGLDVQLRDLGWYAVGLEDDGFGVQGLCMLSERCGAQAAPTALVDTAVAARIAAAIDGDDELTARVAAGDAATALAVVEAGADWTLSGVEATLRPEGDGFLLDGVKAGVQAAPRVDAFLVLADRAGELAWALVPAGAAGVTLIEGHSLDAAADSRVLELSGVAVPPGRVLVGDAAGAVDGALRVGAVATAAEAVGAASAALDMAIEYSREREQFGAPIGSFQALKHLMADAHVDRESAWSSVLYAAAAIDEGDAEAAEAVAIAKAYSARASRAVVEAALQVFGGIAFTWEHDAHLLQRRVLAAERRFGDAIQHERALGARLAARRVGAAA
ncbi:MAG TPA: acyl-CoA dehydrogenase family protein [Solirubrobacterales bacterium]|jgi:alkylation response protein AidB-like acyl-CoA dehydrogenase|nr:acyl-CoA dehydrogenase family protein [Solirubrobacterales bacterium]